MTELTNKDILAKLSVEAEPKKPVIRSLREKQITVGFEDIRRFYGKHGRAPEHGAGNDISSNASVSSGWTDAAPLMTAAHCWSLWTLTAYSTVRYRLSNRKKRSQMMYS